MSPPAAADQPSSNEPADDEGDGAFSLASAGPRPAAHGHEPVLLRETLDALNLRPGLTVVDCTLGRGGHASAIAPRLGPDGLLIGIDADPRNLEFAHERILAT